MAKSRRLDLKTLHAGCPGITPSVGTSLAEAGAVCLTERGHQRGVRLNVKGSFNSTFSLDWEEVTEQTKRCWNDHEVATEHGACGIACLLVFELTDFTIIRRSRKGTGFDYWIGHQEQENDLIFQDKARLEVSGIREGDENSIRARVKKKLRQTERSDGSLPAYIIVVEFGNPLAQMAVRS